MFSREVSYKFKGVNMSASAEWWGSIDEQMKQFKVNRLAVLKKKGGNPDSINIQRLSLRKGSKSSKNSGSKTELAESTTPRISVGETSKPMKPPSQPEPNTQSAVPIYTSTVAPQADGPSIYVNDFAAFPPLTQSLTDEERRLANMTVTERMEYELQKKVSASSAVQSNFDSPANSAFAYNSPTNAWDSLGGGNEGGW